MGALGKLLADVIADVITAARWPLVAAVLVIAGVWGGAALHTRGYQSGVADTYHRLGDAARVDSALIQRYLEARRQQTARVDTVIERVAVVRDRVDTLVTLVPDSLRAVPVIAALVDSVRVLSAYTDVLVSEVRESEHRAAQLEELYESLRVESLGAVLAVSDTLALIRAQAARQVTQRQHRWGVVRGVAFGAALGALAVEVSRR